MGFGGGGSKTVTKYEDKVYVDPKNERDNTDVKLGLQKEPTEPGNTSLLNHDDETTKTTKLIG